MFAPNPQACLVNQAYFGMLMAQRQAAQTNAIIAPASRLFSKYSEEETGEEYENERIRGGKKGHSNQLQPEEVLESLKLASVEALQAMTFAQLAQFLSNLNRAVFVSPKLFNQYNRGVTVSFIQRFVEFLESKQPTELPLANFADLVCTLNRFNVTPIKLGNVFSDKIRGMKDDQEFFEKLNFSQLVNTIIAYTSSDQVQLQMIKEVIKRLQNLDADLSPNKVCVLFHDLLTRGERNAIKNKTFITAFGNYL